jgi:hypothetical protein
MQVQAEVARRLNGPTGLLSSVEYTKEYMRLAAVQGMVLDPKDGSTLYNWFDEFQITQAAEVAFNLAAGTANSCGRSATNRAHDGPQAAQGAFTRRRRSMRSAATRSTTAREPPGRDPHVHQLVRRARHPRRQPGRGLRAPSSSAASPGSTTAAPTTTPPSRSPTTR